eukprot:Gregarina_sp_Poly_1__3175@NODE_18_length_21885_cov_39_980383_g16_i0_p2_GENE_NODE_18_length_21885_cov_39_980383_g16_i0NODE_18_length_21885_cov_39_980383_g16_i0_p2_ORF_typecomplete_len564_score68_47CBP_BcsF/PF11120_8/1_2CBP_BcsF/PF11120_8/9_9e02_NODE_18_length_21885_cov_39_980383_g16_i01950221193
MSEVDDTTYEIVAPADSPSLQQAVLEGKAFLIERPPEEAKRSRRCGCVAFNRPTLEDYVAPFMEPQCTWAQKPLRQLPIIPVTPGSPLLDFDEDGNIVPLAVQPTPMPTAAETTTTANITAPADTGLPPYKLGAPVPICLLFIGLGLWLTRRLHAWWMARQSQLRFERLLRSSSMNETIAKKTAAGNGRKRHLKKEIPQTAKPSLCRRSCQSVADISSNMKDLLMKAFQFSGAPNLRSFRDYWVRRWQDICQLVHCPTRSAPSAETKRGYFHESTAIHHARIYQKFGVVDVQIVRQKRLCKLQAAVLSIEPQDTSGDFQITGTQTPMTIIAENSTDPISVDAPEEGCQTFEFRTLNVERNPATEILTDKFLVSFKRMTMLRHCRWQLLRNRRRSRNSRKRLWKKLLKNKTWITNDEELSSMLEEPEEALPIPAADLSSTPLSIPAYTHELLQLNASNPCVLWSVHKQDTAEGEGSKVSLEPPPGFESIYISQYNSLAQRSKFLEAPSTDNLLRECCEPSACTTSSAPSEAEDDSIFSRRHMVSTKRLFVCPSNDVLPFDGAHL